MEAVTPNATGVRLREARFEDHAAISALEQRVGLKSKPFSEWCALWRNNPVYQKLGPKWPIGWVLEDREGRLVGSLNNLPIPYVFRGKRLLIATGRGWAVEESHRTFALLLMDAYFDQPYADLFFNTTVNGNAAEAHTFFGSKRVPAGDWETAAYLITGYRGFVASALRIKRIPLAGLLSYPASLSLWFKDTVLGRRLPRSAAVCEITPSFDERFDTFWKSLENSSSTLTAERSREILTWHFGESLARNELQILTVSSQGIMRAYGILQRRDEPQYGLKRMRLVDLQSLDKSADHYVAIIRRAVEACRARGIHMLEHVGCGLEKTQVFEQVAPYRRKLPAWPFLYLTRDRQLSIALEDPGAWEPSSFDGDASL